MKSHVYECNLAAVAGDGSCTPFTSNGFGATIADMFM